MTRSYWNRLTPGPGFQAFSLGLNSRTTGWWTEEKEAETGSAADGSFQAAVFRWLPALYQSCFAHSGDVGSLRPKPVAWDCAPAHTQFKFRAE